MPYTGKKMLFILITHILSIVIVSAQSLPDSTRHQIDSLFAKWNTTGSPGCAIGIIRNDSLIYAKGYGMANLEYGIAITPETIFHMASISKQFTAYSIVLLARQGKLKLDDDIHPYLTWFPMKDKKITIRNLLNHTSGIRDQWQLLSIAGTRIDDVITQEHIVKVLSRQTDLNFPPGEQYTYCNSGFTMLAEIVRSVSGQTLRRFTDSAIFKPLGMIHTHFHDEYTEIEKNRAYSYNRRDSAGFSNSILSYSNDGATSLFTNIDDMSKWVMNFYHPVAGDENDIRQLTQKGRLNNGKELNYALGIVVGAYKGWKEYTHGGADAGYRTSISVFPELKMGFVVFGNIGDLNPGARAHEMANLFFKDSSKKSTPVSKAVMDSSKALLKDTLMANRFSGSYLSEDGVQFSFALKNRKLYWETPGGSYLLYKIKNDSFAVLESPEVKFMFSTNTGKDTIVQQYWPDNQRKLTKYRVQSTWSDQQLQSYAGIYYCPELDCKYGIEIKKHQLVLTNAKYNDMELTLMGRDNLSDDFWWMGHLKILRDREDKIIGFEVNDGRVMHLRFNKM